MTNFAKSATLALVMALGLAAVPAAAQKLSPPVIVIVDMDRVVNESAAGKTATTEIQTRITGLQARATTLQNELRNEAEAIQKAQAAKTLAGPALEARAKAFEDKRQASAAEVGRSEGDIQRIRQSVVKQITDGANPIITELMRDRGASIALAEGATLQHSASIDITADVIARLNTSLPRVSTVPPPAPAAAPRR